MSKEPKEQPKTSNSNLDDWTDKQLATLRRDAVNIAVAQHGAVANLDYANDIYNFIKDGKLPSPPETPEPKAGGWK